jgi:uncharacterized protein YbjT (DUF2867 family)
VSYGAGVRNSTTNDTPDLGTVLVLGATGKTGRRVATRLRQRRLPIRTATRSTEHRFVWEEPATWGPALEGVHAVYLVPLDGMSLTGAFVRRAVDAGVRKLVLLSARGVDIPGYYGEDSAATESHLAGERAVRESGVSWTILRPGWFAQNFDEGFFTSSIHDGELRLPVGDEAAAFVDAVDIGEVAAVALTENGHDGQTYELSGPRALTLQETVAEIGRAVGRTIRYVALPEDNYIAELVADGLPQDEARLWADALLPIGRGQEARISDGVDRALGRPPRDFADYVRAAVDAGAWRA